VAVRRAPLTFTSMLTACALPTDAPPEPATRRVAAYRRRGQPHLLPASYRPSDPSAWIGREVTIETRVDADGAELVRYMWLDPPATGD